MKRIGMICLAGVALLVPTTASAMPNGQDVTNAARECRAERGFTAATHEAFRTKYGTNKNKSNAFGKCVSQRARAEESQRKEAASNAAKTCKAERATLGEQAFRAKYGGKANAFGKCVSQHARANKAAADKRDAEQIAAFKNAAKQCDSERGDTAASRTAFANKWGTGPHKRNAFGRCVSRTARGLGPTS